jgi:hypothetical protein
MRRSNQDVGLKNGPREDCGWDATFPGDPVIGRTFTSGCPDYGIFQNTMIGEPEAFDAVRLLVTTALAGTES